MNIVKLHKFKRRKFSISSDVRNQGFSLPAAVGTGLIMLIVGQTLIVRSYNDRVASLGQVAGNGAVSVAEIGLTRYQALLNRNRQLALLNACVPATPTSPCAPQTWRNAVTALAGMVCPASSTALQAQRLQAMAAQDTAAWQDIDASDPSQGQFRLVSYTVNNSSNPTAGYLTVEGRIRQAGTGVTATSDGNTATARLQVTIPLTPSRSGQPTAYPGVWLTTLDTSNPISSATTANPTTPAVALDVRANVFVSDCGVDLRTIQSNPNNSNSPTYMVMQTDMPMPSLPPLPVVSANPGQTPAPNASPSPTNGNSNSPTPPRAIGLGTINTNLSLPRTGDFFVIEDSPTSNGSTVPTRVFRYLVDNIDLPNGAGLFIDTTAVEFYSGYQPARVELYVQGNLVTGSRIDHICNTVNNSICEPTNFRIYAYKNATQPPTNNVYPSFCLQGTQPLKALIFAPGYQIGTSGSARLTGTIWARSWDTTNCRPNSGTIMLSQSGGWGNQQVTLPPQMGAIQQWQRQQVSQETP